MPRLNWKRLGLNALGAFSLPIAHVLIQGGDLAAAARIGAGMALVAAVAFVQPPHKPEEPEK